MRELKFRAWDKVRQEFMKKNDVWIYGDGKVYAGDLYNPPTVEIDADCIQQYTGLKDKNGREIYEDDIYQYAIEINFNGNIFKKYCTDVVKFDDGAFRVGEEFLFDALENDDEPEIIGNIHENPELLGESR